MQPASSARLLDGFMAAMWLGAEKPHQGVSSGNQAWHPAPSVCNSTTALGLRAGCAGNRVRSFCSGEQFDSDIGLYYLRARYYNPATDRFMSRDPEDGDEYSPASLHKYLYANGDPVNLADPTGRTAATATWGGGGDLAEYGMLIGAIAIAAQPAVRALGCAVSASFAYDALKVFGAGAFQVDLPVETQGCGAGSHCIPYEEAIEAAMSEVEARYDEMLLDFYGLYGCRNKKNPWLPGIGSWWGHVDAYLAAQAELVAAIKAAEAAGCPIPPGAEYWAEQPPPSCPSK